MAFGSITIAKVPEITIKAFGIRLWSFVIAIFRTYVRLSVKTATRYVEAHTALAVFSLNVLYLHKNCRLELIGPAKTHCLLFQVDTSHLNVILLSFNNRLLSHFSSIQRSIPCYRYLQYHYYHYYGQFIILFYSK